MSARCSSAPGVSVAPRRAPTRRLRLPDWLRRLLRVRREHRELAALDERQMRDLGITEDMRRAELTRSRWDLP